MRSSAKIYGGVEATEPQGAFDGGGLGLAAALRARGDAARARVWDGIGAAGGALLL
jgi:hypothetical protein